MRVIFRSDASIDIGSGHIMRCITLGKALRVAGVEAIFVCREHPGNLIDLIRQDGFLVIPLPVSGHFTHTTSDSIYGDWLGADWETDARQTIENIGLAVPDWLIVDHYSIDIRWELMARAVCKKIMVIDDLANRSHDCDLLLDQNPSSEGIDYKGLLPHGCVSFVGPEYALLREDFSTYRSYSQQRRPFAEPKELLISMGGVDRDNYTGRVLEVLINSILPLKYHITVVMGGHSPHLEIIRSLVKRFRQGAELRIDVSNMAELMASSDLAIGAAGGTSWERCCVGLPAVVVVQAENQRRIATALEVLGAARMLSVDDFDHIDKIIDELMSHKSILKKMSRASFGVSDGRGVSKVVAALISKGAS